MVFTELTTVSQPNVRLPAFPTIFEPTLIKSAAFSHFETSFTPVPTALPTSGIAETAEITAFS